MIAVRGEMDGDYVATTGEMTLAQYLSSRGYDGLYVFESSVYDPAFMGIAEGRAVYSYELMVSGLMSCGYTEEEAQRRIDEVADGCSDARGMPLIVRSA